MFDWSTFAAQVVSALDPNREIKPPPDDWREQHERFIREVKAQQMQMYVGVQLFSTDPDLIRHATEKIVELTFEPIWEAARKLEADLREHKERAERDRRTMEEYYAAD